MLEDDFVSWRKVRGRQSFEINVKLGASLSPRKYRAEPPTSGSTESIQVGRRETHGMLDIYDTTRDLWTPMEETNDGDRDMGKGDTDDARWRLAIVSAVYDRMAVHTASLSR
jgi:hypothetical protein